MSTPFESLLDGLSHLEEHVNPSVHLGLQDCFRTIEQTVVAFEAAGSAPLWAHFFVERLANAADASDMVRQMSENLREAERLTARAPKVRGTLLGQVGGLVHIMREDPHMPAAFGRHFEMLAGTVARVKLPDRPNTGPTVAAPGDPVAHATPGAPRDAIMESNPFDYPGDRQ
jgi:hypothetical protein